MLRRFLEMGANPLTGLDEPVERGERRRRLLGRNAFIRRLAGRVEEVRPAGPVDGLAPTEKTVVLGVD